MSTKDVAAGGGSKSQVSAFHIIDDSSFFQKTTGWGSHNSNWLFANLQEHISILFLQISGRQLFHFFKICGLADDMLLIVYDPTLFFPCLLGLHFWLSRLNIVYVSMKWDLIKWGFDQKALIDTHVFKLNGYFAVLNPANFRKLLKNPKTDSD